MLAEADDFETRRLAVGLKDRCLPRCIDIRQRIEAELQGSRDASDQARIKLVCTRVQQSLRDKMAENADRSARVFVDSYSRPPYKRYQESQTPLNRILMSTGFGRPRDMAELSPIIAAAEPFEICRAYVFRDDTEAAEMVENEIRTELEASRNVDS